VSYLRQRVVKYQENVFDKQKCVGEEKRREEKRKEGNK